MFSKSKGMNIHDQNKSNSRKVSSVAPPVSSSTLLTKHGKITIANDNLQMLSDACFSASRLQQTNTRSHNNEAKASMSQLSLDTVTAPVTW